jgi:hypothetical protein
MIKIGIAGYGKIGELRYNILKSHQYFDVIGILEKNKETLTPTNINRVSSYTELLNLDIDAVFVCAFNDVLADFTIQAMEKGIHVFCEKPPARTVKELEKVKNAFEKSRPTSQPLSFWSEDDIWDYIHKYEILYSKIYDMGYERTGCMFCMFGVHFEKSEGENKNRRKTRRIHSKV